MLPIFDALRGVDLASVTAKLLLAVLCGGIIGLEREYKRRPAGFRTHILICLGAAMTTLTSQYLYLEMHYHTDMARLGAQVVAGIGFIGAGTIMVTRHQRVKGLTTAAGLWAAAIIGLTLGSGFFEAGLFTTLLILVAELVFSRLEYFMLSKTQEIHLYLEFADKICLDRVLSLLRELELRILNMEITRPPSGEQRNACAIFNLRLNRHCSADQLLAAISGIEGVFSAEEL